MAARLRKRQKSIAGPWGQFTPSHLYDFDGLCNPDCGSDDDDDSPRGDWLDFAPPPPPPTGAMLLVKRSIASMLNLLFFLLNLFS
jgi:hypothetical protein